MPFPFLGEIFKVRSKGIPGRSIQRIKPSRPFIGNLGDISTATLLSGNSRQNPGSALELTWK
jgi:hypothetical protein